MQNCEIYTRAKTPGIFRTMKLNFHDYPWTKIILQDFLGFEIKVKHFQDFAVCTRTLQHN